MAEKTVITGGSGFIGLELAKSLMEEDKHIVVFDLKPPQALLGDKRVTFVRGDITNFSEVLNVIHDHRPEGVLHLAALLSNPSEGNPWASISVNALGTYHILEAARLFATPKLLLTSSMAVYIDPRTKIETVTELTPQRPPLIYGINKVFSELLALYYHRKFGLDTRGIRLPVLLGPNVESPGFGQFNSLLIQSAILGKPFDINVPEDTVIPLLHLKDAVRSIAMLYSAPAEAIRTRIYNVGQITPAPSTADIVRTVREFYPDAQFSFTPDPLATEVAQNTPREIRCDEAQREWGWFVKYSLEDTVKDFITTLKKREEG